MKHGTMDLRGGGGHVVAFTRSTDGGGDPSAASSTTHFGTPADAVTLTRTGAGVYRLTWSLGDYGTNLASAHVTVVSGAGVWTSRAAITRASGTIDFTLLDAGVAANVVSGAIAVTLVFGPQGY